jgi:Domain of unknown function (DUF5916)/Carbohydrate family 9 binding domain-like
MRLHYLTFIVSFFIFQENFAQNTNEKYQIHIKKTKEAIKLDGLLDEPAWQTADIAKDFYMNQPFDSSFAKVKTEVRLLFDDNFIYVAAVCYQARNTYTTASLKRDFEGSTSDVFTINLDTFKDKLNAFQFAINPFNVQREGLITDGSELSVYWDNKWYSQVKNYDDRWEVEVAIPFKTIRYKPTEGENTWRINFGRNCMKCKEISSWAAIPRNFRPASLAFTGLLIWDEKPPKAGANIVLIPYISGGLSADFPRNGNDLKALPSTSDFTKGIGFDAKIAITPSLNLDLTVNPDFSQVEVDKQVTNLSRFELFFPERRQFFLENNDLFGKFGFPDTRAFFSRRIGIASNPNTGLSLQVPILAGARLSGKLNQNWRIGLMNMQTDKVDFGNDKFLPAANYAVAVLQRKVFKRSTIGAIFVNKDNFLDSFTDKQKSSFFNAYKDPAFNLRNTQYNRVAGLEFNYNSPNNKVETETYYHHSFSTGFEKDAGSFAHFMGYHGLHLDLNLGYFRIGENYRADVGFVPRTATQNIYRNASIRLNPKSPTIAKTINSYGIGTLGSDTYNLFGKELDHGTDVFLFANSPSQSQYFVGYSFNYTYLTKSFDPTNASYNPNPDKYSNVVPLPANTEYSYRTFFAGFQTSQRNSFFGDGHYDNGQYFNGTSFNIRGNLSYRWQPYGIFSLAGSYTKIDLPKPNNSAEYYLIGPKAELSFSRSLFFSTFFQYNTQTNNTNINSRLQWRFRPVSDLFLVYTDNYFAESIPNYNINSFTPRNRALVLKITYWFNV